MLLRGTLERRELAPQTLPTALSYKSHQELTRIMHAFHGAYARLTLTICSTWLLVLPATGTEYTLKLDAGPYDREQTPVSVGLSLPFELARHAHPTLVTADGARWPAQLVAPESAADAADEEIEVARQLHFILPKLAAGESVTLRLTFPEELEEAPTEYRWNIAVNAHATLSHGDRPVLRYMFHPLDESTPERREQTYKVFHHLFDPSGEFIVTKGPGGQYTHHRGLFFGFNRISYDDHERVDTWHCRGDACLTHEEFLSKESGPVLGSHTLAIDWHGPDKEVFAEETRRLTVYHVPEGQFVEFSSELRSTGPDIRLDGDPQHAGFHFRAANVVAAETSEQTYFLRPDGKGAPNETRNWPDLKSHVNLPWNAMSFVLGDDRFTAVYLDHPQNPKEARFSERAYGRFGSYFEYDLTPDRPLRIRYRLWLQPGELTGEQAAALSHDFVDPPSVTVICADATSSTDNTPPEGFVSLFNGRDLEGWKGLVASPPARAKMSAEELAKKQAEADQQMREHWSVVDGALRYDGQGNSLCTARDYDDFELMVDWKIGPKGDSGIYLRGSPQVQIWDDPIGSGGLYNNQEHPSRPTAAADRPVGEWNTFHLKMVDDRVTVRLNGQLVVDDVVMENYWERDKPIYPTGQIELQHHGNPLWFKNIYLRELNTSDESH